MSSFNVHNVHMNSTQFKKIQDFFCMTREQMADLLCCSISAIASYKADEGVRKRNIPKLVEKTLINEVIKRGGNIEVIMGKSNDR